MNTKQLQEELRTTEAKATELRQQLAEANKGKPALEARIKNFDDILSEAGITAEGWAIRMQNHSPYEIAHAKVVLITEVLNEGNVLSFADKEQEKWFPVFTWSTERARFVFDCANYYIAYTTAGLGPRLCFFSDERATFAGTTFEDEYNAVLTL